MTRRTEKVAALLHQEIGALLARLELPALTTISKVEVSPDLKWSKVWVTVLATAAKQQEVLDRLNEERHEMQQEIIGKLRMKFVPKISFVIDHGEEYADHINELLKKTYEE